KPGTGGATGTGGAGGKTGTGGATGTGGSGAGGAGTQTGPLPGDLITSGGQTVMAAHSVTRALFAAYNGKLFNVRRASDGKTQDINTVGAGGLVDLNALNTFCSGTTCTVAALYDQTGRVDSSGRNNDMTQATAADQPTVGFWTSSDGNKYPMIVSKGYQWLRNRNTATNTIPTGSQAQTEYFIVHGDYAGAAAGTNGCCYDYGNMEKIVTDQGPGTMSALYFGDATDWTRGAGNGPWVMLDMENGVFAGGGSIAILNAGSASVNSNDPSLKYAEPNIVTGLAKTNGTSTFEIKYGNASTGTLSTAWNGSLPTNSNPTSYIPLQQKGGISLGEGGDGSAMGTGAFSEGCIVLGETSDATDDAIQMNLTSIYK
ncbi:MAG TPA: arabinofuranosidase catalytic domain-containing protein, partial [Polyangia bacterium]|nr:arabinofuranosidase catalytic domain-containing protein [Polyangia bacterium]